MDQRDGGPKCAQRPDLKRPKRDLVPMTRRVERRKRGSSNAAKKALNKEGHDT